MSHVSSASPAGRSSPSRKLPIRDYLAAIAIFVNAVKGISALQLGRDLDVQYKTAFVMAHKIREASAPADGDHRLPARSRSTAPTSAGSPRRRTSRPSARTAAGRGTDRQAAVGCGGPGAGRSDVHDAAASEAAAVPSSALTSPRASGPCRRGRRAGTACTLTTRCIGSTIRSPIAWTVRAPTKPIFLLSSPPGRIGQHHHISGNTCGLCGEMAWKEDNRRQANGTLHTMVTGAALAHPASRVWAGYWQRTTTTR